MTPDEAYEQFDDLLEIRNTLREIFEEHLPSTNNCPYVKAEVFKDLEDDRPSPLKHTVYQFEVIMNTLLGSFGSYRSPVAISLLSHITTTLDQISILVSEQLGYEADSKIKSGEIKLTPDAMAKFEKKYGLDNLEKLMQTQIPEVYLQAFSEDENE